MTKLFKGRFNPKRYAEPGRDPAQGEVWTITPAHFYPAMIGHIRTSIGSGELPPELIDKVPQVGIDPHMAAARYLKIARGISEEGWGAALQPPVGLSQELLQERANALECARLWFTRALKNGRSADHPLRIHILDDPAFRLGL